MSAQDPQFAANYTDRYGEYMNPLPEVNSFRSFAKFVAGADRSGNQFIFPVQTAISHGQTADKSGTAYALNPARSAGQLFAKLDAYDITMREVIPYPAMMQARNGVSLQGDAAAYWDPIDLAMMTTMRGAEHYAEIGCMFGPGGGSTILADIGVVDAVVSGTNWNAASVVRITRPSWMVGMWNNAANGGNSSGGMLVDVVNSVGTTVLARSVPVVSTADSSKCQVSFGAGLDAVAIAPGQRLVPAGWAGGGLGAVAGKACVGVQGILENNGTFANINAGNVGVWRARQIAFSGGTPLTRARILSVGGRLFPNGLKKGATLVVNANTFVDLAEEPNTLTRWDSTQGAIETKVQGTANLQYITSAGIVNVMVHEYMKQGFAFFLENDGTIRIGAGDITYRGANGNEDFFLEMPNNAGSEIRNQQQQAPLLLNPYRNAILSGFVNNNDDVPAN